ncbi:MAG: hypothetical protein QF486_00255 [Candidatus Woesearchaeota archaeon]|nr:hypothetical protein [Candidatus Woesearchaeota archaeon]MDP7181345.1 hypothetical protein [Candidatus Woesearchaeota archaeon]MDP7198036.1 hypothetical protein [Candidatus Woesearchaeota archaeon]MDP7466870.1 hypothetical protein [Candidatus Woesearchaeota archaeon]
MAAIGAADHAQRQAQDVSNLTVIDPSKLEESLLSRVQLAWSLMGAYGGRVRDSQLNVYGVRDLVRETQKLVEASYSQENAPVESLEVRPSFKNIIRRTVYKIQEWKRKRSVGCPKCKTPGLKEFKRFVMRVEPRDNNEGMYRWLDDDGHQAVRYEQFFRICPPCDKVTHMGESRV